jgi:hypothetical protein
MNIKVTAKLDASVITREDAIAYDAERLPLSKTLLDLEPCECKWPMNSGGPFLFCAAPAEKAYCDHHKQRSAKSVEA